MNIMEDENRKHVYSITMSEPEYIKIWKFLYSNVSDKPDEPLKLITKIAIKAGLAAICFNFEPSFYLGWAFVAMAMYNILKLFSKNRIYRKTLKFLLIITVSISCLFWVYSFVLGILIIVFTLFITFYPVHRIGYEKTSFLHKPFECGFDSEFVWFSGDSVEAKVAWEKLTMWGLTEDWLVLIHEGNIPIYLPRKSITEEGQFDWLMEKAKTYAIPYGQES